MIRKDDYQNLSDAALAGFLRESDHTAFKVIYDRYHYLMLVHAYKKLRNEDLAKDMVQDLFANLWIKRNELSATENLSGYLFIALRNKIIDYFAHQKVESKYIASLRDFVLLKNNTNTDHLVREKELQSYIDKQIQALPPKMRGIFELSRKSNLSYKEIAETLSLSKNTVNSQMVNALGRLRTKLGLFMSFLF